MIEELSEKILRSDKQAVAKGISLVENGSKYANTLLKKLYKSTGKAIVIGITGPPGAGKSTITNQLAKIFRKNNFSVGIIAVDPTSPFTGGALLGDRIRMSETGLDPEVFIRSMATRGSMGGLSGKAKEACEILDASGKDFILLETVGVGQSELDVAQTSDCTIVVLVPESGDAIQTMKAGLMEIGDIFVINKSDREGADALATALRTMLHLKMKDKEDRQIKVLKTIASQGKGIEELFKEITEHNEYLIKNGKLKQKRKTNLLKHINELVNSRLEFKFWSEERKKILEEKTEIILNRESTPYELVDELIKHFY